MIGCTFCGMVQIVIVLFYQFTYFGATSFPGSVIMPPPGSSKIRGPGNEVESYRHEKNSSAQIRNEKYSLAQISFTYV